MKRALLILLTLTMALTPAHAESAKSPTSQGVTIMSFPPCPAC